MIENVISFSRLLYILLTLLTYARKVEGGGNSVHPDQTAAIGAVWPGLTLLVKKVTKSF